MSNTKSGYLSSIALVAAFIVSPVAHGESTASADAEVVVTAAALHAEMADRYAEGLRLRAAGNPRAAFLAFREAAQMGHAKAQRRLGEIYDAGDAVSHDYSEALRWYQAAREQGEEIPVAGKRGYTAVFR